jgi:hypothetical protein
VFPLGRGSSSSSFTPDAVKANCAPLIVGSVWSLPNLGRGAQRFVDVPFGHGMAPWLTKAVTVTDRREKSTTAAVMKYLRRFIPGP